MFRSNMKRLIFKPKTQFKVRRITYLSRANIKPKTSMSCLIESFYSFVDLSKINGLYYLRRNPKKNIRWKIGNLKSINSLINSKNCRYIWTLISMLILAFAGILIHLMAKNFFQNPTLISHATPMSLMTIPFPAITICPSDAMSPIKLDTFLEKS